MNIKTSIASVIGRQQFENLAIIKKRIEVTRHRVLRSLSRNTEHGKWAAEFKLLGVENAHAFFGYYDICPFSADNTRLLAMSTPAADYPKSNGGDIRVGFFDLQGASDFVAVDQTQTWCWQMGCRLQWYPGDPDRLIMYNAMVNGQYGSIVQDIRTQKVEWRYASPFYTIDRWGLRALSLNFSRLQRLRPGYGYSNLPDASEGRLAPDNDGIWRIDLISGDRELIIDLRRLATMAPLPSMKNAEHYVNHLSFNPSGMRFMFFHLWVVDGQRYNRLITSNWAGTDLCVLESQGTASHYTWKSESQLLATVHYGGAGTRYNLYTDQSDHKTVIAPERLNKDGHPSYSPQGDRLVTDTYPDKYREQHLLLLTADGQVRELARLYTPPSFRAESRCDLHPRWDRQGRWICVDDTSQGVRKLALIEVPEG